MYSVLNKGSETSCNKETGPTFFNPVFLSFFYQEALPLNTSSFSQSCAKYTGKYQPGPIPALADKLGDLVPRWERLSHRVVYPQSHPSTRQDLNVYHLGDTFLQRVKQIKFLFRQAAFFCLFRGAQCLESPFSDFSKAIISASLAPRGSFVYLHLKVQRLAAKCHRDFGSESEPGSSQLPSPVSPCEDP